MAGGGIRGSKIGAGPLGEPERGDAAPRRRVSFYCVNGHETRPAFAEEAEVPATWDCPRCGVLAGQDKDAPPPTAKAAPFKTHLAYVQERRNPQESEELLHEALQNLRKK
jgi:rubredoxin